MYSSNSFLQLLPGCCASGASYILFPASVSLAVLLAAGDEPVLLCVPLSRRMQAAKIAAMSAL